MRNSKKPYGETSTLLRLEDKQPFGRVSKWLKDADCKSVAARFRWFKSSPTHHADCHRRGENPVVGFPLIIAGESPHRGLA